MSGSTTIAEFKTEYVVTVIFMDGSWDKYGYQSPENAYQEFEEISTDMGLRGCLIDAVFVTNMETDSVIFERIRDD
jgi:hypothetical protein